MSAGDSLSPQQFTEMTSHGGEYRHDYYNTRFPHGAVTHRIDAYREYSGEDLPDDHVGHLEWHEGSNAYDPGEISSIEVAGDHQRQGVASAMYAMGRAMADLHGVHPPVHSAYRTSDEDAWAHAVTPRHKLAPADNSLHVPKDW